MKPPLRILHLEDCESDYELVQQLLVKDGLNCEVVRRDTRAGFIEDLKKRDFDLIFADCTVPEFNGVDALELARQLAPEIPFIFVSGTIGEDFAIESLHRGATDYVLKNRLARLIPAVRRAIAETTERAKSQEMEQRLRQAQRLEAVGTLAGGVAHDFNNILTIIQGHASLLLMESRRPDRVDEIAATINHAAQRGADLVSQLLAFARKSDSTFTSCNINHLVRGITAMLREAMPRNITFELQLDDSLPEIDADPGQVERVLVNLATNARDAMPNGGKLIFVTSRVRDTKVPLHSEEGTEDYLCLCVTDTGTGMDEATRQHIFEPFFTTKPKGKGTGLGMSVVYGLMQSHNGLIDVQSELGKGSSISLFLPIPTKSLPCLATAPLPVPKSENGGETVLIVDDEMDVTYFIEVILKSQGYRILMAASAEEALEKLRATPEEIHLLFSDIGLPTLDGFGLSAEARKIRPRLKIMLTSGYTDGSLKTRMTEAGIDGFLAKPYDTSDLLAKIRAILDKR
jgi:signal transduction histidine kinase